MSVTPSTLLSLPVIGTGTESGTWGNYVNNGLTSYLDNVIAGTISFSGDGAITLANTAGDNAGTNIGSTTAQYAMIRVTGTLTTTKVITAPSYSKIYIVTNAATGGAVTIKASGQTGVSVAVGETATVYYNGTDYVKSATTLSGTGTVTSVSWTGGIVSVATSTTTPAFTIAGTSGGIPYFNSGTTWATSGVLTANALVIGGGAGAAPTVTTTATGALTFLGTPSSANLAALVTDETGSGSLVFATSPTLVTPILGTPTSGNLSNCTADGTTAVGFLSIPQNAQTGSYTLVLADAGKHIYHASGAGAATYTIPANGSVAYPIGTAITFLNMSTNAVTISITTDTMYLSSAGTTGSRTLAQYGSATAIKMTSTTWLISGSGLT
jgi:hypothetical protein